MSNGYWPLLRFSLFAMIFLLCIAMIFFLCMIFLNTPQQTEERYNP
jgi:hypothetical protein